MQYGQKCIFSAIAMAALLASHGASALDCTKAEGTAIKSENGNASLVLLPGGTAEYSADGKCTVLGLTGLKDGKVFYTDDGMGRGFGVLVSGSLFEIASAK